MWEERVSRWTTERVEQSGSRDQLKTAQQFNFNVSESPLLRCLVRTILACFKMFPWRSREMTSFLLSGCWFTTPHQTGSTNYSVKKPVTKMSVVWRVERCCCDRVIKRLTLESSPFLLKVLNLNFRAVTRLESLSDDVIRTRVGCAGAWWRRTMLRSDGWWERCSTRKVLHKSSEYWHIHVLLMQNKSNAIPRLQC